ncbi:MAG: response regulator [Deltaproteobacteria bacterium]|nr:response regulator [Deltaproteobacteria bacterium]
MRVLVVQEDRRSAFTMAQAIEGWGYYAETAQTGHDAVRKVSQQIFEVVLLEIFLPDMTAHDLIPRFKQCQPKMGIITMTPFSSKELEREIRIKGIIYYLIKPFDLHILKDLLDHNLKNRRRRHLGNGGQWWDTTIFGSGCKADG